MSSKSETGSNLRVDGPRLLQRLAALGRIGDTGDGGARRLALSEEDRQGRLWLIAEMKAIGLTVESDKIGNIFGTLPGREPGPPIMLGSHIDTVGTGGRYDGAYGVLAGLEALAVLRDAGMTPRHSICVAAFTNEEGARFQPDMMGSCVHAGVLSLEDAYAAKDADGVSVGEAIRAIDAIGPLEPGAIKPRAYLELHIEQGPVLDSEGPTIGAVTGVQGIRWFEITLEGESNHAGTTPISYRRDPGLVASALNVEARTIADSIPDQRCTVGRMEFTPGQINVVPKRVTMTLDLRNPSDSHLDRAETHLKEFLAQTAKAHAVTYSIQETARFAATPFDERLIVAVEGAAKELGHATRRMVSGAGHDAQLIAAIAPAAMIFVPSVEGLSHNPREFTKPDDLIAGANVLLAATLRLADA
ncbi:MAG: M20 family metallo-hydrolase [Beijerinckiaceae bacterium]|nr:M20 family metallo-hydrolase [Beijerinckiaceae bacterium]